MPGTLTSRVLRLLGFSIVGLLVLAIAGWFLFVPAYVRDMLVSAVEIQTFRRSHPPDRVEVFKQSPTRPLEINLFLPQGQPSGIGVVLYHGGAFIGGWPAQLFPVARDLNAEGHTVFVPAYRVQNTDETGYVEALADARDAVRWVVARAEQLGITSDRLVYGGSSAGSHFPPAMLTLPNESPGAPVPQPLGLLLQNPYVDSTPNVDPEDPFAGRGAEMSPINHLRPGLPPMILFHGEEDQVIPIDASRNFCAAVEASGNPCRVEAYPGGGHSFAGYGRPDYDDVIEKMKRAIAEW